MAVERGRPEIQTRPPGQPEQPIGRLREKLFEHHLCVQQSNTVVSRIVLAPKNMLGQLPLSSISDTTLTFSPKINHSFSTRGENDSKRTKSGPFHHARGKVSNTRNFPKKLNVASEERTEALVCLDEDEKQYYKEVQESVPEFNAGAPGDFYEMLGLELDAGKADVRSAYRTIQRIVHPDLVGECANDFAILLNAGYRLLSDDNLRHVYDSQLKTFRKHLGNFDGTPVSVWCGKSGEQRAVFVDETACIGCRNCTLTAPSTFTMEDDYGKARVSHQWGDDIDMIKEAIDMCPVDCIYYVKRKQLALLEFVMKFCKREDPAILARRRSGNMGPPPASENPFQRAEVFLKYREDVHIDDVENRKGVLQDELLSAAIAKAWLQLPTDVRARGWPSWVSESTVI